ncbi:MAG: SLOG family protein [Planctomycetes bacterium]|nr:SLOG family protein [Planctomycetota bacterium]
MTFRVLIIGSRQRFEYARLRDALDALLAKRLPDVEILTAGGPSVPALAACYASSRGLSLVAIPIDHIEHPGNTIEQRDARLVELADAAVGDPTEVRELLARAAVKGVRVVAVGATPVRSESGEPGVDDDGPGMVRGLPD